MPPPPPVPRATAPSKLVSIAQVYVKPDKAKRMSELILNIKAITDASEEGTLQYRVTQSLADETEFLIYELYTGVPALEVHYNNQAFVTMLSALEPEDILDVGRGGVKISYFEEL